MDTIIALGTIAIALSVAMVMLGLITAKVAHDWAADHNIHSKVDCYIAGTLLWLMPGLIAFWTWNITCYFLLTSTQLHDMATSALLTGIMFSGFLILALASVGGMVIYLHWREGQAALGDIEQEQIRQEFGRNHAGLHDE